MPTSSVFFPQINSNFILTQYPYRTNFEFDTASEDLETGMRYAFSRRDNTDLPDDYATTPLGRFSLNFPAITDAEVSALQTFFNSMYGRFGTFQLLDPGGNLLQYSEDFTPATWVKDSATVGGSAPDPVGGSLSTSISFGEGGSISAIAGPSNGGIEGFILCASVHLNARSAGQSVSVGFTGTAGTFVRTFPLPQGSWVRISYPSFSVVDDNPVSAILTSVGGGTVYVYGFQVSPMKGEATYTRSPDNWGYHPNCRFDTDVLQVKVQGPDQNSVALPCFEFNWYEPPLEGIE